MHPICWFLIPLALLALVLAVEACDERSLPKGIASIILALAILIIFRKI